jgi:hypothetical protein
MTSCQILQDILWYKRNNFYLLETFPLTVAKDIFQNYNMNKIFLHKTLKLSALQNQQQELHLLQYSSQVDLNKYCKREKNEKMYEEKKWRSYFSEVIHYAKMTSSLLYTVWTRVECLVLLSTLKLCLWVINTLATNISCHWATIIGTLSTFFGFMCFFLCMLTEFNIYIYYIMSLVLTSIWLTTYLFKMHPICWCFFCLIDHMTLHTSNYKWKRF